MRALLVAFCLAFPALHAAEAAQVPPASPVPPAPGPTGPSGATGATGVLGTDGEAPPEPDVAPWTGTFAEGMAEVARLTAEPALEEALAVTDALLSPTRTARWRAAVEEKTHGWSERALGLFDGPLTWLGVETRTSADRGEIHYARGLVQAGAGQIGEANGSLELARVLSGPGATRLDAMYNLGAIDLAAGELFRAKIPELAGGAAPPPPPAQQADEEAPDPLEVARAAYVAAREHFIERLRADWRDADTRANVELVVRRLKELDEIEREREEQEQQENEDQQQQDQQQDGDSSESGEEQNPEDQPPEDEQPEEQEGEEPPEDEPEGDEEAEPEESTEEEAQAEPEERILTEEEVKRLLEELEKLDKEGEELRERLRGVRRQKVDKDW